MNVNVDIKFYFQQCYYFICKKKQEMGKKFTDRMKLSIEYLHKHRNILNPV